MSNNLKFLVYLLAAIGFSAAFAGSYEDYFQAIKRDDAGAITGLLQRGFDPNTPSPEGVPGLILAIREPSLKAAEAILASPQTNVETRTAQDESPLMMAALKGHTALVKELIARGADVNKPGWAPLHYAATGGHLDVMELLLENYAFIDAESPNGTTPLMMAAMYGSTAAVKLLLDAGADTAMRNKLGLSAIDFAQRANRLEAAELIAMQVRSQRPRGKW
jgi:ankyrin repeat protein